jgi:CheY-like chemotaxis protein
MIAGLSPAHDPRTPRALIADPDPLTHALCRGGLEPLGFDIVAADDGREALERALTGAPSLILAAMNLPFISGLDLIELIRRDVLTRSMRVVLLTDGVQPSQRRLVELGVDTVLGKPLHENVIREQALRLGGGADAERWRDQRAVDRPIEAADESVERAATRFTKRNQHQRGATTVPPGEIPLIVCPVCDVALAYERSYVGGVNARFPEQWDHFVCPRCQQRFEYRHRTRRVRAL